MDMQAAIERATRDFVCGELAHMALAGVGVEVRFESEADRKALFIYLDRRAALPLRPLTIQPPRRR